MQLLKWLRQEGALPRDLAYPLEDAEESLADFSRLQRVLKEHPTLEDVVLKRLARRYQLPLCPGRLTSCGLSLGASRKHSFMNPCC